jgi:hypothetical protein
MNNAERDADSEDEENGRRRRCDPDLLDELKCKAQGIQAEADYNKEHGPELDKARDAYKTARASYNAVRKDAEPHVAEARRQLEELEDRVRCQLDREDVERIDTAFGRVVERLNRCGHERDCCCDEDCDYDDEVRDRDPDDVPGLLAVIEYRTKEVADCFWSLIGEHTYVPPPASAPAEASPAEPAADAATAATPAAAATPSAAPAGGTPTSAVATDPPATPSDPPLPALPTRVKDLQAEIEKISKAAADGSWEPANLYSAVLVARRHLRDVWRGFRNVNEYMECLCRALTCMIKGHAAIGELTRQAAVNKCYRESRKAACKHLADNTAEEVLAEYLRVRAEAGDEDEDEDEGDEDEEEDQHRDRRHRDRDGDEGRGRGEGPVRNVGRDDDGDDDDDDDDGRRGRDRRRRDSRGRYLRPSTPDR